MSAPPPHAFQEGDRVRAIFRPGFPAGTIMRVMDGGYLLVRWDGDVLETAHHGQLMKELSGPSAT